jgi:hypothetical protein
LVIFDVVRQGDCGTGSEPHEHHKADAKSEAHRQQDEITERLPGAIIFARCRNYRFELFVRLLVHISHKIHVIVKGVFENII